jgi:hypothetical protein
MAYLEGEREMKVRLDYENNKPVLVVEPENNLEAFFMKNFNPVLTLTGSDGTWFLWDAKDTEMAVVGNEKITR